MTVWDKIYKSYKKDGKPWGSLKDDLLPEFLEFVKNTNFISRNALDIGCGDGRYLDYLQKLGFKITGIDSSKTAIEMSRKVLGSKANLIYAEMFGYDYLSNEYDLVFSLSSIHHGFKKDISKLIDKIYSSLLPGGFAFITLPDISDIESWDTFKNNKKLEEGTFSPLSGPETGLAHSFFNRKEIENMFSEFSSLKLDLNDRVNWVVIVKK
ncbi:MAG: class I SAM-dependent methyltransferase [Parcubacteria group bacterium]|jgi:SAM-dependent methyltransferase